jgi:hypothetical protein
MVVNCDPGKLHVITTHIGDIVHMVEICCCVCVIFFARVVVSHFCLIFCVASGSMSLFCLIFCVASFFVSIVGQFLGTWFLLMVFYF